MKQKLMEEISLLMKQKHAANGIATTAEQIFCSDFLKALNGAFTILNIAKSLTFNLSLLASIVFRLSFQSVIFQYEKKYFCTIKNIWSYTHQHGISCGMGFISLFYGKNKPRFRINVCRCRNITYSDVLLFIYRHSLFPDGKKTKKTKFA